MCGNFKWEVESELRVLNITNSSIPWSSCISHKPHQILSVRHGFLHLPNNCKAERGGESGAVRRGGGEGGEGGGLNEKKNWRFNENLTFPIKSLCSRVSYLAMMIVFSAEVSAGHRRCCCCFLVCPAQCTQGGGLGRMQDVETSERVQISLSKHIWASTLTYYLWSYSADNSLRIGDAKPRHAFALHFSAPLSLFLCQESFIETN